MRMYNCSTIDWYQNVINQGSHAIALFLIATRYVKESEDNLSNYGPGMRFGASLARVGYDMCVSHLSFRFSSALECRSAITVVLLAVRSGAGLVLHSSFIVFHCQVSSGSAGYLPFVSS